MKISKFSFFICDTPIIQKSPYMETGSVKNTVDKIIFYYNHDIRLNIIVNGANWCANLRGESCCESAERTKRGCTYTSCSRTSGLKGSRYECEKEVGMVYSYSMMFTIKKKN